MTFTAHFYQMIKVIAFDLDDTLLDTTGILLPKASEDSFKILIQAGLKLNLKQCEEHRVEMIKHTSHKEVFKKLTKLYGDHRTEAALPSAIDAFYDPKLPEYLPLLPGAKENLELLKNKYTLVLVTAGTQEGQKNKIRALGIEPFFSSIYIVDSLQKKKKADAFLNLLNIYKIKPEQLLCIGNSLLSEIKDALEIGAIACYFQFGEKRGDLSQLHIHPHFTLKHHKDLIPTCKL